VLGDLRAQRGAFFAVWLAVVLGLAFYGATYPAGVALIESFMATYRQLGYADFNARLEGAAPAADVLAALEDVPGLAAAEGRLVIDAGLTRPDGRITLRLITLPDAPGGGADHPAIDDVLVMAGQEIANPGEILVLKSFADRHAIVPGDTLEVWVGDQAAHLTVAGLVFAPEYLVAGQSSLTPFPQLSSFGVAYIPYATLAVLSNRAGAINDVGLRMAPDADESAVRRRAGSGPGPLRSGLPPEPGADAQRRRDRRQHPG
jgi:putative ABC transport system permease protein